MSKPPLLVTIAVSHYCEKARWALDRLNTPYTEEAHAPMLHWLQTYRRGGGRTVPMLVTDERTIADSSDILRYLDESAPAALRLYPDDPAALREVLEWEELFDNELGPPVRRWAYSWLLDHPQLFLQIFAPRMSATEQRATRILSPVIRAALRRAFKISATSRERSLAKAGKILARVDAALADGRRYLVADRFSAADLTLASLAAVVIAPPEYGSFLPAIADLPAVVAGDVQALRDTPAGRFVRRIYTEHRRQPTTNNK